MLTTELILEQEKKTALPHFGLNDLNPFIETLKKIGGEDYEKVCVLIKLNHRVIFFHAGQHTTNENNIWIGKKERAVDLFDHSSLYEKYLNKDHEDQFFKDSGLSPKDIAIVGGGLPLIITGTGIVGSLIISGLTDEGDHDLGYRALLDYKAALS